MNSKCCDAKIMYSDICSLCKEHCDVIDLDEVKCDKCGKDLGQAVVTKPGVVFSCPDC